MCTTPSSIRPSPTPVGGHDHLDLADGVEAIQLRQKLHECALNFTIRGCALAEAATPDGVDLVHEYDAWLVLLQERAGRG